MFHNLYYIVQILHLNYQKAKEIRKLTLEDPNLVNRQLILTKQQAEGFVLQLKVIHLNNMHVIPKIHSVDKIISHNSRITH